MGSHARWPTGRRRKKTPGLCARTLLSRAVFLWRDQQRWMPSQARSSWAASRYATREERLPSARSQSFQRKRRLTERDRSRLFSNTLRGRLDLGAEGAERGDVMDVQVFEICGTYRMLKKYSHSKRPSSGRSAG